MPMRTIRTCTTGMATITLTRMGRVILPVALSAFLLGAIAAGKDPREEIVAA